MDKLNSDLKATVGISHLSAKSKQSGIQTITAVIPAKDEEKNIARCIESVKWCDKIIILWMGSDQTGKIAKSLGAEVIRKNASEKDDFKAVQKNINRAIDNCTTDWILRVDADEVVSEELKNEIISILNSKFIIHNSTIAYGIPRKPYFLGAFLKGGDWAYDRLVRLFKAKSARYDPIVEVHEQFKVEGKIGYLQNSILHYSHPTLKDVFRKFNSYTDVQIHDLNESLPTAFFKILTQPPYIFLRWTIWHLGIRDGWRGILSGLLRAWYEFILYKKYIAYQLHLSPRE
ncbi:hypothetical protein A2767_05020 [Candidatus Roizmanbacteria bacterium RIFCSPHIGHO2_01_FULL_35_10]|uniref:Glycosyltransferase 2-like domain-containing protein n=1 Tax=Candidatus Roizmanbacteria bacterium RIFCSPLOWO2_01_FULL_35_13 TaxID=1802055 RepID=A0A1F7I6U1_9BACT|nr:MAG: hypothetical protein A2767_05020 [Candidatus Roizmanbacteria bacterium RIFCSPHIGHO2_01_FULL_35_10]OGK39088.1 MAG: hypothetical protein A3A74_05690 [Candidatus Roizmanbacteria bacterium RIFCSPLOWO2_01_FULL_35_13]